MPDGIWTRSAWYPELEGLVNLQYAKVCLGIDYVYLGSLSLVIAQAWLEGQRCSGPGQ